MKNGTKELFLMSRDNKAFGKKPADIARGRVTVRHPFQKVAILVDGDFFFTVIIL